MNNQSAVVWSSNYNKNLFSEFVYMKVSIILIIITIIVVIIIIIIIII